MPSRPKPLIETMAAKKIAVDPTLVVVEGVLTSEAGKVSPAYTAYVGTFRPRPSAASSRGRSPFRKGPRAKTSPQASST